jgi:hypothetical protein
VYLVITPKEPAFPVKTPVNILSFKSFDISVGAGKYLELGRTT